MAHPKKEDTGIFEILQASSVNGDDPIKGLLRYTVQQVLEEELTAFLKAEPYTRTDERRGYRNGYKPRTLKTRVGQLELLVPDCLVHQHGDDDEDVTSSETPAPEDADPSAEAPPQDVDVTADADEIADEDEGGLDGEDDESPDDAQEEKEDDA